MAKKVARKQAGLRSRRERPQGRRGPGNGKNAPVSVLTTGLYRVATDAIWSLYELLHADRITDTEFERVAEAITKTAKLANRALLAARQGCGEAADLQAAEELIHESLGYLGVLRRFEDSAPNPELRAAAALLNGLDAKRWDAHRVVTLARHVKTALWWHTHRNPKIREAAPVELAGRITSMGGVAPVEVELARLLASWCESSKKGHKTTFRIVADLGASIGLKGLSYERVKRVCAPVMNSAPERWARDDGSLPGRSIGISVERLSW